MGESEGRPRPLAEIAWVFLKLGTVAFGGPAAHVAMMRREVVLRREWVGEQEFLDGFAATSLIPGPGSTQLAMYLAKRRAGWVGLLVGGACFILPAAAIVMALAWAYVRYGSTPTATGILYGVTPVVVAIIVDAIVGLGARAVRGWLLVLLAAAAVAGYFAGLDVIALLLGAGLVGMLVRNWRRIDGRHGAVLPLLALHAGSVRQPGTGPTPSLPGLLLEFLKLGAITFGSGYVLLAYLNRDLVGGLGWLTPRQLLDAVAVGQVTPGPVFSAATFIGYLLHGTFGAILATVGIFLPSFVLIAALGGFIARLRRSTWAAGALDGVNAAALGVMAGVCWDLGRIAIGDPLTAALAVVSWVVLVWFRVNYVWLIVAGGVVGILHALA